MHNQDARSLSDYIDLADAEIKLQNDARNPMMGLPSTDLEEVCQHLLRNMQKYQGAALAAYKNHTEQLSLVRLIQYLLPQITSRT